MAYTFTVTEVTPTIGLTVTPAAQFTVTNAVRSLYVAETNPQFTITDVPDNQITVNDDGYVFTLTNVDSLVLLTNSPAYNVTSSASEQNIAVTQNTNNFNFSATNITFTATTAISQIQTENMATIFKGEFTSTDATIYYRGHIVRYNQNIYVATVEPSGRVTNPAAPPGNPQWTLVFSQTGLTGWQVEAMEKAYNIGPWTAGATYVLNSWVSYNGYIWQLNDLDGTYGSEPSLTSPYWQQIGSQGDQPLFTTSSVTFRNLTITGNGIASNFTVTNRLTAGGIRYPITPGLYGQVLTTNGVNEANWTDAASTGSGTLRPATRDNLGGVIIGTGINVSASGVISITTGTNGANIGWNLTDDLRTNGYNIVTGAPAIINNNFPVPKLEIGSGLTGSLDSALIFDARTTTTSQVRLIGDTVILGSGNPYSDPVQGIRISSTGTSFIGNTINLSSRYVYIGNNTTTSVIIGNTTSTQKAVINNKLLGGRASGFGRHITVEENLKIEGYLLGATDTTPVKVWQIQFPDNSIISSGNIQYPIATTTSTGLVKIGSGLTVSPDGTLRATAYILPLATTTSTGGIKIGAGLAINGDGVVSVTTTSNFVIPAATDSVIGGFRTNASGGGDNSTGLYMDGEILRGRILHEVGGNGSIGMVRTYSEYGITANNGYLYLVKASTTRLGGVRVDGVSIVIDGNGIISAVGGGGGGGTSTNYFAGEGISISAGPDNRFISLNTASTSTIGGITLGTGLVGTTNTSVVSITSATSTKFGGVVIGPGLTINNSGKTTIQVGNNLSIDGSGNLNVINSSISNGVVSLTEDMLTNGYEIRNGTYNSSLSLDSDIFLQRGGLNQFLRMNGLGIRLSLLNDQSYLDFNQFNGIALQANSDAYKLTLQGLGASIVRNEDPASSKLILNESETIISNPVIIRVQAPDTQFGSSIYDSRIYAAVILNYSGTGPPLLAEGVQYGDLSVQRTAYPGYDYGQIIKSNIFGPSVPQDFNNLSLAVDFNR